MAKDKKTDRKTPAGPAKSEDTILPVSGSENAAGAGAAAVVNAGAQEGAEAQAPGGDGQTDGPAKDEAKADTSAPGIALATVLSTEAKLAVIKAAAEIRPGGEYAGRSDYVISGISDHFKVTKKAVAAELEKALAAELEKATALADTVVITVPRRFALRVGTKETLFRPGTIRVSREVAEHPYVKANGCKIV